MKSLFESMLINDRESTRNEMGLAGTGLMIRYRYNVHIRGLQRQHLISNPPKTLPVLSLYIVHDSIDN